jgi:hypothetical protein
MSYDLRQVRSELLRNSALTSITSSPLTLRIFADEKDIFEINSRYGFSQKTLKKIDSAIRLAST